MRAEKHLSFSVEIGSFSTHTSSFREPDERYDEVHSSVYHRRLSSTVEYCSQRTLAEKFDRSRSSPRFHEIHGSDRIVANQARPAETVVVDDDPVIVSIHPSHCFNPSIKEDDKLVNNIVCHQ